MTAIYYAFFALDELLPNRTNRFFYYLHVDRFMAERYDEAFVYEWLTRRWSTLLADESEQFESHLFPLSILGQSGWALFTWLQGYERFWRDRSAQEQAAGNGNNGAEAKRFADDARSFGEHVKGITEQYQLSYIELDRDLAVDKVCDIFTQINSRGIRLDISDLVNALLKPRAAGVATQADVSICGTEAGLRRNGKDERLRSPGHVDREAGLPLS